MPSIGGDNGRHGSGARQSSVVPQFEISAGEPSNNDYSQNDDWDANPANESLPLALGRVDRDKPYALAVTLSRLVISLHPNHVLRKQTVSLLLFVRAALRWLRHVAIGLQTEALPNRHFAGRNKIHWLAY